MQLIFLNLNQNIMCWICFAIIWLKTTQVNFPILGGTFIHMWLDITSIRPTWHIKKSPACQFYSDQSQLSYLLSDRNFILICHYVNFWLHFLTNNKSRTRTRLPYIFNAWIIINFIPIKLVTSISRLMVNIWKSIYVLVRYDYLCLIFLK